MVVETTRSLGRLEVSDHSYTRSDILDSAAQGNGRISDSIDCVLRSESAHMQYQGTLKAGDDSLKKKPMDIFYRCMTQRMRSSKIQVLAMRSRIKIQFWLCRRPFRNYVVVSA